MTASNIRLGGTIAVAAILVAHAAGAAQSPFGIATPDGGGAAFGGPLAPVFAWIAARQSEFYQELTATLSSAKDSGVAVWVLLGLSFAYGVFHAAGPGHGKAVITSYLIASGGTARHGVVISFAAALAQAVTAILVVTVAALILNATAQTMTAATDWLEIGSYGLIVAIGLWLVWSKAFGGHHHHHHHFAPAVVDGAHVTAGLGGSGGTRDHHHHHHHHQHHERAVGHAHSVTHHGASGQAVGAAPMRNPLARAWSAVLGVGIRPCSGAIIVLVFALSQGLFVVGVASTFLMALGTGITVAALAALAVSAKGLAIRLAGPESEAGHRLHRAVEIVGALVVLVFGLLLLGGAISGQLAA